MKRRLSTAVIALAGAALLAPAAHAAENTYTTGDLLLGFSEGGISPSANDYIVDIGSASTYLDAAPGSSFNVSDGNIGADLSSNSLFGSGWATDTDVTWGIAGATSNATTTFSGVAESTVFLTEEAGLSPLLSKSISTVGLWRGSIDGTLGPDFNNSNVTANSNVATIELASNASSWTSLASGGFQSGYSIESTSTPVGSELALYELQPFAGATRQDPTTPGILIGDFTLNSDGVLKFTAAGTAAVPEPSTYALMAGGMAFLVWQFRRKSAAQV